MVSELDPLTPRVRWTILVVSVVAVVVSLFHIAESDLFWHLKTGERILVHGIEKAEVYSYTSRVELFYDHEWLAEVVGALLHRLGGFDLLVAAKAAAAGLLMLLLAAAARSRGASGMAIPLALLYALVLVRFRLYVRPELFTFLLLPVADLAARHYLRQGSRWVLFGLPAMAAVWSNLHPGVLLGVAVLGAHAVGSFVDGLARRRPSDQTGKPLALLAAAVACIPATFVTPYGAAIFSPLLEIFSSPAIASAAVREWQPPAGDAFMLFFLLAAVATVLVVVTGRRISVADGLLWLGTGIMALTAMRYVGMFAVVTCPVLARQLTTAATWLGPKAEAGLPNFARLVKPPVRAGAVIVLGLWIAVCLLSPHASLLHMDQSRHYRFGTGLDSSSAPIEAVDVLEAHRLPGPVYNSWAFGGYVVWRSWPRLQVFLDGRDFMYIDLIDELRSSTPVQILVRYQIRTALVAYEDETFARALLDSPTYGLVAFDDRAMLFTHRNQIVSDPALEELDLLRPDDPSLGWYDALAAVEQEQARQQIIRAVKMASGSARPWAILGAAVRRQGDLDRARDAYLRAISLDRGQMSYHNNLGLVELDAGRIPAAVECFEKAIALNRKAYEPRFNLGLALVRSDDPVGAAMAFRQAARLDPGAAEPWYLLGRMVDDPDEARAAFEQYLKLAPNGPHAADARRRLAATRR